MLGSHVSDVSMDVVGRTRNLYGVIHVGDHAFHAYDLNRVWLLSKQNVAMAGSGGGNPADGRETWQLRPDLVGRME